MADKRQALEVKITQLQRKCDEAEADYKESIRKNGHASRETSEAQKAFRKARGKLESATRKLQDMR